jgi:ubiquinone/menaquinone biosynthesis C-methylase UbiE
VLAPALAVLAPALVLEAAVKDNPHPTSSERTTSSTDPAAESASLPSAALLEQQARWLRPARSSLLRRAAIAQRHSLLDLGAGRGLVTPELVRRSSGRVVALDRNLSALHEVSRVYSSLRIVGDAAKLPFVPDSFDLVFSQFTLLWVGRLRQTVSEIWRVLMPGGQFCAIEPDYPSMIEYPPEASTAGIWTAALRRAGATIDVGRRLPALLEQQGFKVQVRLLDQLLPPSKLRFDSLRELPLTPVELAELDAVERHAGKLTGWQEVAHLPLFLINASLPARRGELC